MNAEELLKALAPLVAPALEEELGRRDFCILATRVVVDVGRFFGVVVRGHPCKAIAYNAQYAKHIALMAQEGRIESGTACKPDWSDGSHSVGIGFGYAPWQRKDNKWDGHLIAVAEGWWGDFSIQAAERVEKGIITGPAIVGPWYGTPSWAAVDSDTGTHVEYRSIEDESYYKAPDWKRNKHLRRPLVGKLIRTIRP